MNRATHFNDNDIQGIQGVQIGDQEIKIVNYADDTNFFWGDINSFLRLKPILTLYEKASNPKINFSKNLGIINY